MTQREAVYAMLKGEKPDVIINGWEPFALIIDDVMIHQQGPGPRYVDAWGVTMIQEEGQFGAMPSEAEEDLVCPDITEWKSYVKVPDPDKWELDFSGAFAQIEAAKAQGKILTSFLPMGPFETSHNILGFEEGLIAYLEEPEDMKELVDTIFEFKKKEIKIQIENWKPECFLLHDDFGSKQNLLLPPDTWREFFKEGYRELAKMIHESGAIVMLHSDSNNELIASDLEEIGIDIWQGVLPTVNVQKLQKELKKMVLMGGYDSGIIDRADTTDEELKNEVMRVINDYVPGGRFIPCISYGGPGTFMPDTEERITKVIRSL